MSQELGDEKQKHSGQDSLLARDASPMPERKLNLRRLESIQRLLQYGAGAVLIVFIALIAAAWFQLRGIRREIGNANATLQQKTQRIGELQADINALEARQKVLEEQNAKKDQVLRVIERPMSEKTNQNTISLPPPTSQIPARIYIQIGNESQRRRAAGVSQQLEAKGYVVPGIENVTGKALAPNVTELRYYQTDDEAQNNDINDISTVLSSLGIRLKLTPLRKSGRVRPRHYELWFGTDFQ